MHTNSIIEINRSAYQNNIDFIKKNFGKTVIFSSVVKGNAYGHGIAEFVTMAFQCGVNHFSVFDVQEAKEIKKTLQNQATILVMGLVQDEEMKWVVENNVEFFVFDKSRLEHAVETAKKAAKKAIIHIEVETGMNRTGFDKNEINTVISIIKTQINHLHFKGLCTHYAGAESIVNHERVSKQIETFEEVYEQFCRNDLKPTIRHTACSAASIMFPEARMDLIRIGIIQYGLWPSPEVFVTYLHSQKNKIDPLQRVISWKSSIMSVKSVNTGDFIGYGTSFMAKRRMNIATVPIGYSHGYSRSLSNQGRVLIHGQRCIVIGSVNMNMMTVDVTDINLAKKNDEVVLIGTQEELSVTVASFSDFSNQLNYELLTRISTAIPRKIIE
ncbi:alanine racemase [Flavobacterium segetis]|uniref:Alanine racemase n=1 Tax=Flavobacterium segetis TaxID=271157 RepID=A0A1M5J1I9_9FLAO|nr:alanine racemase [Flavobacterium segetis]SHG34416.1 alanine racemase [Flavobacterium segetis]